jgi:RecB family exonuclease
MGESPHLPRRLVIEAWRSPYFDWACVLGKDAPEGLATAGACADALDRVARWGRVIRGLPQWDDALNKLAALSEMDAADEERGRPANLPSPEEARWLLALLGRFVALLAPPGPASYRDHVAWLEDLMGDDPLLASEEAAGEAGDSLRMPARIADHSADPEGDRLALQALKEVLRGFVWAEVALGAGRRVSFDEFVAQLVGSVEGASYSLPAEPERPALFVSDVVHARGIPFRAVALLGLAEGEFPAAQAEDPFLRDADRARLREAYHLDLEPSTQSAEAGFFYETVARASARLLLTRPRLADNGAEWLPSPYWPEIRRLVDVTPETLAGGRVPALDAACSVPELMEALALAAGGSSARLPLSAEQAERAGRLGQSARRFAARATGIDEGDLRELAGDLLARYGPAHTWSASRLEAYRACPFFFFVAHALGLEVREEPVEGLDVRQLGNIYHHILEAVYQAPAVTDTTDLEQLRAALPDGAGAILDDAPEREGFRETAWWPETRATIIANLDKTLGELAECAAGYKPMAFEAAFDGEEALVLRDGDDTLRLHGLIDRVDRGPAGVRIIDYKTGGIAKYTSKALEEGEKLQIALYALAARDALQLGEPVDGFYWSVTGAKASSLKLADYDGGAPAALERAAAWAWQTVRDVRQGRFVPQSPRTGCPSYCPAREFCWQYRPGFGG